MPAPFLTPAIVDNEEGWGPNTVPELLEGVPYAPYAKAEKVGRISDFTQSSYNNKYGGRFNSNQAPGDAVFNFFHDETEDNFHLVDSRPAQRKQGGRRFQPNRFQQQRQQRDQRGEPPAHQDRQPRKQQQKRPQFFHRDNLRQAVYTCSVDIRPEWAVVEQIPFASLAKLSTAAPAAEDVTFCGSLQYYDKAFDRITPKEPRPLQRTKRAFRSPSTSDDPIIKRIAAQDEAQVFITEGLLTTLMCAPRSVYSWDVVITRAGGKLFFDRRDDSAVDLLTTAETAPEAVAEDRDALNGVQQLSQEATIVNQNFSQQVLLQGGERFEGDEPNPFRGEGNEQLASVAYRYRKFRIVEGLALVARCELDGVLMYKGEELLLSIKALNEFDPKVTGVDWRQKLENQRGAVLATELKNNANKLAKWTAAALVSGADIIKLGYVSRNHPRDNKNHVILGTQVCKPKDFATQINLNMDNCWGIVRALVDLALRMDDGKYLIVKDPNKPLLRLYSVPEDAFQENYTEEPLPEPEEAPAVETPRGAAAQEQEDEE